MINPGGEGGTRARIESEIQDLIWGTIIDGNLAAFLKRKGKGRTRLQVKKTVRQDWGYPKESLKALLYVQAGPVGEKEGVKNTLGNEKVL